MIVEIEVVCEGKAYQFRQIKQPTNFLVAISQFFHHLFLRSRTYSPLLHLSVNITQLLLRQLGRLRRLRKSPYPWSILLVWRTTKISSRLI